jgi:hypothetical protein
MDIHGGVWGLHVQPHFHGRTPRHRRTHTCTHTRSRSRTRVCTTTGAHACVHTRTRRTLTRPSRSSAHTHTRNTRTMPALRRACCAVPQHPHTCTVVLVCTRTPPTCCTVPVVLCPIMPVTCFVVFVLVAHMPCLACCMHCYGLAYLLDSWQCLRSLIEVTFTFTLCHGFAPPHRPLCGCGAAGPVRRRTRSLLTSRWACPRARSRRVPPAARSVWPSTTRYGPPCKGWGL